MLLIRIICSLLALLIYKQGITQNHYKNNDISIATGLVNSDSLYSYIEHLESYGTRSMLAPNRLEIAKWLEQKFITFGIDSVRIDTFTTHTLFERENIDTTTTQYNVVATILGSSNSKLIACAHYDSWNSEEGFDPNLIAPGADDDASGTAACLEIGRVLSEINFNPEQTIEIIAFGAEELMNFGKGGYDFHAEKAFNNNEQISLVLHNDMIAFNEGSNTICLSNYEGSKIVSSTIGNLCETYTNFDVEYWPSNVGPFADRAFYNLGYKCIYFEEKYGTFMEINPYYHSSEDKLDKLDENYCAEVTKINVAGIMHFDKNTPTSITDQKSQSINIYPNPVNNKLSIHYNTLPNQCIEFSIYNLLGEKLSIVKTSCQPGLNTIQIPVNLPNGIYQIAATSNSIVYYSGKFIVAN